MKYAFLKQMLSSGMTGMASSKRGAMVWFILLFTAVAIVNLSTSGRVHLSDTLQGQLFELVIITIGTVFGEPAIKLITQLVQKKQAPEAGSEKT
jgi:NADH:ubiquinone oxidoreductase subunit K